MRRPVACVDFDGTLVSEGEDGLLQALPGAQDALRKLRAAGYQILISTCRVTLARRAGTLAQEVEFIEKTLERLGIPFDAVDLGDKPVAEIYIDDRAVSFEGNWAQALEHSLRRRASKT